MDAITAQLLAVVTFQAGFNTTVVMLGAAALGCAAGAAGTFAMLRRRALVSDAVAHGTLPGIAAAFLLAALLGRAPREAGWLMGGAGIAALISLLAIEWLGRRPRVGPDTATAAVLAAGFGLGLALMSVVQTLAVGRQAGLESLLFGSAAGMLPGEAQMMAVLAVFVLVVIALLLKEFSAVAFDPDFAATVGLPVARLDALVALVCAVVVVAALPIAGFVLAVALVVIPPAAARFWSDRAGTVVAVAAAIGAVSAFAGAALSAVLKDTPTGPAIVLVAALLFTLSLVFGRARGLLRGTG
ncbi:MAG: metal ABC transporter permease [Phreatobacter sp.]|uniref:metal ABC transporter permease n=1 Tax=Phreatobacter sp. TaxID=1966341 RepID=UPI0027345E35|nr:metal ABC transporter permease [Phreatobacter sp.]MDP2803317.1 metal ABC transporter permease [Phreatobacter sp.]